MYSARWPRTRGDGEHRGRSRCETVGRVVSERGRAAAIQVRNGAAQTAASRNVRPPDGAYCRQARSREHAFDRSSVTTNLSFNLALLALCAIDGASWPLIAREAQKRGRDDLDALISGDIAEASADAEKTRIAILAGSSENAERLERAALAIDEAASRGARLTTVLDDDYPANLRLVHDLPPFLFYRGTLERADARSIAVVGTRQASSDGLKRARQMARGLVQSGVTVLSGLARGIDTAAHEEALAQGGRTVAVLGNRHPQAVPAREHRTGRAHR